MLISACIDRCGPHQKSLADKLLDEEALFLAVPTGSVYALYVAHIADRTAGAARRRGLPRDRYQVEPSRPCPIRAGGAAGRTA